MWALVAVFVMAWLLDMAVGGTVGSDGAAVDWRLHSAQWL